MKTPLLIGEMIVLALAVAMFLLNAWVYWTIYQSH